MKLDYPATGRNSEVILAVLQRFVPATGQVLEVASGSGQHASRFAAAFPDVQWQPTDPEAPARASIDAYREDDGPANLQPALALDTTSDEWPIERADLIYCANMIHIAPWSATEGLVRGAKRILGPGGTLFLYGPFRRTGVETAASNERFHRSLISRNPSWGVRHLDEVTTLAVPELVLEEVVEMPANNVCVVMRRP